MFRLFTKKFSQLYFLLLGVVFTMMILPAYAQTDLGNITRGVVAVKSGSDGVYVGWRLLGTDPDSVGFNLYRIVDGGAGEKLNESPLTGATNYFDSAAVLTATNEYFVKAVVDGIEQDPSDTVNVWQQNYLTIPLDRPAGGTTPDGVNYDYSPNDASTADLDGDGELEIILKWNPSNAKDNSQSGYTGNVYIDAYEMDGTRLWRVDMGINIRAGAHYTQFMVYDFDSDGKAEMAVRTSDGAVDGVGTVIGDGSADYRNSGGYILTGPEYLTMFDGETGAELASTAFEPARGNVNDWGDSYGNRVDRFLGAVAYLDGPQKPSLVFGRGIYTKVELAAWDWDGSSFTLKWHFKSQEGYNDWSGMGSHNLSVGDVDADGKDEIVYGHCAIDDNGTGLWSLKSQVGTGTGDAMHLADILPDREGLERWACGEGSGPGSHLVDAATGEVLWATAPADVGRATAGDLSPDFYGMECWGGTDGLRSATNARVGNSPSSVNHVVWWDGDLSRELLDGTTVSKYQVGTLFNASGCSSNNGSKANPSLQADIFGDWREEVIWRTSDNNNLRIYTTIIPTEYRITTLMHDHTYRMAIAWQNNSYNQPPHTGFYLGNDMFTPAEEIPPSSPVGLNANVGTEFIGLSWNENKESDLEGYNIYKSTAGSEFVLMNDTLVTATSIVDSAIVLDTQYEYYVTAVDTDGNESASSIVITALPTYKPDPPTRVRGRNGYNEALVFWDPVVKDSTSGARTANASNARTAEQQVAATLMHSYTFADGTANDEVGGVDGTLNGDQISILGGKCTVSGATSNTDGYISLDAAALALNTYSAITLEAYLYTTEGANGDTYTMLAYFGNNTGGDRCLWYQPTRRNATESRAEVNNGTSTVTASLDGVELDDGNPHHVVVELTNTALKYYLDGELVSEAATGGEFISTLDTQIANIFKGADGWADPNYNVSLEEFNIYDGTMDSATIADRAVNFPVDDLGPGSDQVIGYNVYYTQFEGGTFQKLNSSLIRDTYFHHADATNGTTYYYKVTSVDSSYRESFFSDIITITPGGRLIMQAEDADFEGVFIESNHTGFNGTGFANFDSEGYVEFKYVYTRFLGWYEVIIRHALGNTDRTGNLSINDSTFNYTMAGTGEWTNYVYDTIKAEFNQHFDNTIRFEATGGDFGNLDEVIIGDRTSAPEPEPEPEPDTVLGFSPKTLLKVYPNPFNDYATFEVSYEGIEIPNLSIINLLGQEVKSGSFDQSGNNKYTFQWDGTNNQNARVAPGIYFGKVYIGSKEVKTIRIALTQ